MRYQLRRDDGDSLNVDSDVWLCALDLALRSGWVPEGVESGDDALGYVAPSGQRIREGDASAFAAYLSSALATVPDSEVPMMGKAFGTENTLAMLRVVREGGNIPSEDLPAAAEILSGPPKGEASELASFLSGGAVTLNPA